MIPPGSGSGSMPRMSKRAFGRRQALLAGGGVAGGLGLGLWFWPSSSSLASYPFMHRVGGSDPLWRIAPDKLAEATLDDARRLSTYVEAVGRAVSRIESEPLVANELVDTLGASDRKKLRELFWQ